MNNKNMIHTLHDAHPYYIYPALYSLTAIIWHILKPMHMLYYLVRLAARQNQLPLFNRESRVTVKIRTIIHF